MDARDRYKVLKNGVYLEHSCDEWVIGGEVEVKALIADLQLWLESQK